MVDRMASLAPLNSLTLAFDDDSIEDEARAGHRIIKLHGHGTDCPGFGCVRCSVAQLRGSSLAAAWSVIMVAGGLIAVFVQQASYGLSALQVVCLLCGFFAFPGVMWWAPALIPPLHDGGAEARARMHRWVSAIWSCGWLVIIGEWWLGQLTGRHGRIARDDPARAYACCAIWVTVLVVQHVVHLGFAHRMIVLALALSITLTSEWQRELSVALLVGEASGHALDCTLRHSFLRLEQLRREKERVALELALAKNLLATSQAGAPATARATARMGTTTDAADIAHGLEPSPGPEARQAESSDGSADGGASTYDTNSEVARLVTEGDVTNVLNRGRCSPGVTSSSESATDGTRGDERVFGRWSPGDDAGEKLSFRPCIANRLRRRHQQWVGGDVSPAFPEEEEREDERAALLRRYLADLAPGRLAEREAEAQGRREIPGDAIQYGLRSE
jgi:hypothetical protein